MIIYRKYDENERIDRVWYDSSNVLYSECEDKLNDFKTLKVVFKGGGTYKYKNVDVNDYVMFIHGGLDGSNGRALSQFIKKYEFEKLDPTNVSELNAERELLMENDKQKESEV